MVFLGSNVVTCHLKINRDLGVLQQAEPTKTFKKIRDSIMFDGRRTIDELEALTGVSWSSCQRILTELHMKRVAAKFVPCLLLEDQRANRLDVCREMKDQLKADQDFLSKIITGDESWC